MAGVPCRYAASDRLKPDGRLRLSMTASAIPAEGFAFLRDGQGWDARLPSCATALTESRPPGRPELNYYALGYELTATSARPREHSHRSISHQTASHNVVLVDESRRADSRTPRKLPGLADLPGSSSWKPRGTDLLALGVQTYRRLLPVGEGPTGTWSTFSASSAVKQHDYLLHALGDQAAPPGSNSRRRQAPGRPDFLGALQPMTAI